MLAILFERLILTSPDRSSTCLLFPPVLGWDSDYEASFTPFVDAGVVPGRVIRVDRGLCDVLVADPDPDPDADANPNTDAADPSRLRTVRADWSGISSGDSMRNPCTGDWAAVDLTSHPASISSLLPRRTAVVRGSAGERSDGQVLAANVDHILISVSLAAKPDAGRIERLLALAWESGACPVVVLTKADAPHDPGWVDEVASVAPGVTVLAVSAVTGSGMPELAELLGSGTAALLGQSGVGKSTLTNALCGAEVMATGGTRAVDEKGRHTTTTRELIPLPGGGALIDTPGLRSVGLFGGESGVDQAFNDVLEIAGSCRFADCGHASEPGCAVTAAVASGDLPQRRLDSYRKLLRENAWIASRSDARMAAERQREWKIRSRSANPARP